MRYDPYDADERRERREAERARLRGVQREELIAAARVMLPEHGLALPLGRLAVEAGVARTTAAALFDNSGAVAAALVQAALLRLTEAVSPAPGLAATVARLIMALRAEAPALRIRAAFACGTPRYHRDRLAHAEQLLALAVAESLCAAGRAPGPRPGPWPGRRLDLSPDPRPDHAAALTDDAAADDPTPGASAPGATADGAGRAPTGSPRGAAPAAGAAGATWVADAAEADPCTVSPPATPLGVLVALGRRALLLAADAALAPGAADPAADAAAIAAMLAPAVAPLRAPRLDPAPGGAGVIAPASAPAMPAAAAPALAPAVPAAVVARAPAGGGSGRAAAEQSHAEHGEHRLAMLVGDAPAGADDAAVGLAGGRAAFDHLHPHGQHVARPHRPQPADLVHTRRAEAGGVQQVPVAHAPHHAGAGLPAAGDQPAIEAVARGHGIGVEHLRVIGAGKGDDFLLGQREAAEIAGRSHRKIFEIQHVTDRSLASRAWRGASPRAPPPG